ncbi:MULTISPECIES: hypothetical protein [Listeria]|uniref:hypothetical protein n=1 Tax=Listeria TaxID=1637 RepID=UPI000B587362|nr:MULTISPECIES: hypothetical protein [Listeria]
MRINLSNDTIKETFGEIKFLGMVIRRKYDTSLPEEQREITSVTVNLGAEHKNDTISVLLQQDETGKFKLPNVKKWGNVTFDKLVYDPRAQGNSSRNRDSGESMTWGTLNDIFYTNQVLPASNADRIADENGEKIVKK